ncbi:MAG: Hsp20/alpha crystallin family protein [Thermoleophilia bacterium]|nr:Hsp20/alpha crystallin family protein [Thermoleophilia bacterium]
MAIVTWDPTRDLSLLQGDVNRLFERFFGGSTGESSSQQRWTPAMDVAEEGDEFVLRADLPGLKQDDVSIEVQERTLRISGERRFAPKPEHDGGMFRLERAYGRFERTITLPEGVDADAIHASFENGVLELHVPKPVEAKPRRIEIGDARQREVEAV